MIVKARARWGFIGSLGVLVPAFLLSLYAGWPSNVLNPTGSDPVRAYVAMSVPQGWAFFTKPPDDPEIGAYEARTGRSVLATPQTRVENAFGLSRTQRAQGPELAILASQVTKWQPCGTKMRSCVKPLTDERPTPVQNESFFRTICGRVILTSERPVPWAYREFGLSSKIEERAFIDVDCSKQVAVP